MGFAWGRSKSELAALGETLAAVRERSELLDEACGIGLWEAVLHNADALHEKSIWTWSAEFRRLIGYDSDREFPNVVQSWSDRLHPDDVAATFAAFGGHLTDKTGRARYNVVYRLKVRDGSYRWFRATGGCRHAADGTTIRACGSLTDIHEQKTAEEAVKRDAAEDQRAIDELARGLAALSAGDVTFRIDADFPAKTRKLKDDFNASIASLATTMGEITRTTDGIRSGAGEISQSADDLSRRTEQQAASLEETAAALDQITATVRKTAEGAKHASEVVAGARGDAERSGQVVQDAVVAMGAIEKSAQEISQIIGVIDEIAFQTNLLALNAGVEAARAGDAGRGFAVVASEVRALAQRSAEAAKEIKGLISTSSSQVASGVTLVGETGKALSRIVSQVNEITGIVAEISASAQEQAVGLAQVNTAVNQMDQMTQQNAAMVEESTAASHSLSQEAEQLSGLIGRFGGLDERAPRSAARPASRPVPTSSKARPAPRAVSRPAPASRGNLALKQPEPAQDGWEEF